MCDKAEDLGANPVLHRDGRVTWQCAECGEPVDFPDDELNKSLGRFLDALHKQVKW